ncbi:MAG: hypothetical protein FK733_07205 [Asgard group archaeon]|nr:hypothetical protein [Asgard group archaeon]
MEKTAKEDFIEFLTNLCRLNGYDELSSRIIALLYIEPKEISLEELAKNTGYSLSAVSMTMKSLDNLGMIKRMRKPGTRKVFFYFEKNFMGKIVEFLSRKLESYIRATKEILPNIIEKYNEEKTEQAKMEQKIVQDYFEDVLIYEGIISNLIEMIEKVKR